MSRTLELLRAIPSPVGAAPGSAGGGPNGPNPGLYPLAQRNKIGLLYLESLNQLGRLADLAPQYEAERAQYQRFLHAVGRAAALLHGAGISFALFKTLRPYPGTPTDVDILLLGDHHDYVRAAEVLLQAGYHHELVVREQSPHPQGSSQAARHFTTPTYGKRHISATGTCFIDPENGVDIDLKKDIATSYIVWLNKEAVRQQIVSASPPLPPEVKTLTPPLDLAAIIVHSLTEQLFMLWEFYALLYHLEGLDASAIEEFLRTLRENHLIAAARAVVSLSCLLQRQADGGVSPKLTMLSNALGWDGGEAHRLEEMGFTLPHRFSLRTLAALFWEKRRDPAFRRSFTRQM